MGNTNNSGISIYEFVVFGVLLVIGISMINGIISTSNNSANQTSLNSYQLTFTQNPVAGQIITMDNTTFQFSNGGNVSQGYVGVLVGNTTNESVANLKAAVQNNTNYGVE